MKATAHMQAQSLIQELSIAMDRNMVQEKVSQQNAFRMGKAAAVIVTPTKEITSQNASGWKDIFHSAFNF